MNKVVFEPMIFAWLEKLILLLLNVIIMPERGVFSPVRRSSMREAGLRASPGVVRAQEVCALSAGIRRLRRSTGQQQAVFVL